MKLRFFDRYLSAARRLPGDEDGIVLIWVTIMLVAIIGLAGLALDASRYRSLKTQMQAGADALALAGARELDGSDGSITRATSAINTMINNTPQGMGVQSKITAATITFYSSLYVATNPAIGAVTTNPNAAKYVGVTVAPATAAAILPLPVEPPQINAMAVAGYDFALCNMPPVFICNPYEQPGDTNETANNRWRTSVSLPENQRQMMKLTVNGGSGYGPGHFGFLMPPDNCNGASCLRDWIATYKPKACYRKKAVDLNTGQMQSVFDAFNVRFDMYSGSLKANNADYPPALNVRKGYKPANNACGASANINSNVPLGQPFQITGTTTKNGTSLTNVAMVDGTFPAYATGLTIVGEGIQDGTAISSYNASTQTITLSQKASAPGSGTTFTIAQQVLGLPRDADMIANAALQFGNGQWDCQSYWKTVHGLEANGGAPVPSDIDLGGGHCGTGPDTTVSRFAIYHYENNKLGTISPPTPAVLNNDYSGPNAPTFDSNGETGAPICSSSPGIQYDDGGGDRRVIYAAIINCASNASLMNQGGQTADDIPVAGFGKFFMTEPADSGNQALYGEMTGAVGLDKNAKNNVQLYR